MSATALYSVDFDPLANKAYQSTGLGEPLVNYLASKRNSGRAEKTLRDKEVYIGSFALMFPSKTLELVTSFDVMQWEAESKVGLTSRRIRRSHLNDFFEWCVRWDLVDKNPVSKLDSIKKVAGKVYDIFSDAEVELLCGLPLVDGALLQVMFHAGLRKGECIKLQPRLIRANEHEARLVILDTKGGKDRLVPLRASVARSLALLQQESMMKPSDYFWYTRVSQGRTTKRDKPVGDGSFHRWWERVINESGVPYRNPHMTRHTFANRWLRRGGRLETLSRAMGHSSISITHDLYGHLDDADVYADFAAMEED